VVEQSERDIHHERMAEAEASEIDPHVGWTAGRTAPLELVDDGMGGQVLNVFRRDHTEIVMRDGETFSTSIVGMSMAPFMGPILLGMDGEEHSTYRKLVSPAFRQSALTRWEKGLVEPIVTDLLDRIAPLGRADLVSDFTARFPTQVIAGIMGVPIEDADRFQTWAQRVNSGPLDPQPGLQAAEEMREYLAPIVKARRIRPQEDLISDILQAEVDGERLDDEHVFGFLMLLMPAGAETTFRETGIALLALLTHNGWMDRLRDDPSLVDGIIEETLRWESSAPLATRVATQDTELDGFRIPAGTRLILSMSSANRDEEQCPNGGVWDPYRETELAHLAFGWGRHLCLGMHLARLEMRVALTAVAQRLSNLRLDPAAELPRLSGVAFRGPESLPVIFDPASKTSV
jgi:cytochrome P450